VSETATKKATLIGGVLADNARNQISLFKVPLCCEAAAGLGCGVKAKPILHALTRQPAVAQAWLNRGGTIVAVLWRESVVPDLRGEQVRSILAEHGLAARELAGAARESALKEFSSGAVWYRGDAVDRLSAEEAAIIAARLVRRVTAKVPLSNGTVKILLAAFSEVCRHQLTDRPLTSARLRRKLIANEILQAGRRRRRTNCRTARSLRSSISLRREGARSSKKETAYGGS
jgi:hypothetical protein